MGNCFIMQYATDNILLQVTNVCAKCYNDIKKGDTIYYDTQGYHYLCEACHQAIIDEMETDNNDNYNEEYYGNKGLFA